MKRWIGLILIAVLWGYGAILAWTMKDAGNQVFLYCGEGSAVEAEQISQALEREQEQGREMPPEISAWSRTEKVKVMNPVLGRSEEADCIIVYGHKEMASYRRLLGGTYGYRSDQDGCVISSGLAMELFGGPDVTGTYIWCREKAYRIQGVTDDSSLVILLPAKAKDAMRFMLLTRTDYAGMETGKTAAERFLYRNGIHSGKVLVDGTYFSSAAGFGICLPLWMMPLRALTAFSSRRERKVERGREIRGCILAAVFFLAGTFLAWKLELKIPADLIPSRWSDFEFWARRIEELRLDMAATGEAGAVRWLAQLKGRLAVCLICSLAGGAGGIMWRRT